MWYTAWIVVVYDSPSVHPTISDEEKTLIQATTLDLSKVTKVIILTKL